MTVKESIIQAICTDGDIHFCKEMDYHVENIKGINIIIATSNMSVGDHLDVHIQFISDCSELNREAAYNVIRQEIGTGNFFHRHNFYEGIYVITGTLFQIINGQEIPVEKNQIFLMNTGVEHMDRLSENTMVLYIQIPKDIIDDLAAHCKFSEPLKKFFKYQKPEKRKDYLYCTIQDSAQFEIIVNQLIDEQKAHLAGYKYVVRGLICRILMIMNGQHKDSVRYISSEFSRSLLLFRRIEQFLEDNCWNVDNKELSDNFYYSENYLNTLFKNFRGVSIQQYCRDCKLSYAARLLKEEKSVVDIITQLGYHNKTYFYKIFKEKYRMTPNEYKKIMK